MPLFRVGGSFSGTNNRRPMDSRGTKTPYKYTGAEGSQIGYFNIYPYAPRSKVNSLTNGRYCGSVIYSQNGGNPQQSLIGHKQRDLGLLATERDHNYCRVPTWGFESRSRFPVAVYEGLERMETKTADFSGTLQFKGDTRHRSFCISSLPPTSLLYFLETGPIQQGERCISKVMEITKGICFSTFQPNSKRVKESSNGPGPALTGNSNLAKSVFVSPSSSDVSRQTNFDSTSRGSFNGFKDGKAFINRERKIKTSGLDNFREKLFAEEISKNAAELTISAKRQGSITHYEPAWGKWDCWCSRKEVDPISGPLNAVLDSLAELFLVKGIFNKRPPIPRYTFIWDVQKVLTYLSTLGMPEHLSDKMLTLKTTMLIALTSSNRAYEICSLNTDFLVKHPTRYTFHLS